MQVNDVLLRALDCFCLQLLCGLTNLHHLTLATGEQKASGASLWGIPAAVSQLQLLRSLRLTGHTHMHMFMHSQLGVLPPEIFLLGRWESRLSTAPKQWQWTIDACLCPAWLPSAQHRQPPCMQADQA